MYGWKVTIFIRVEKNGIFQHNATRSTIIRTRSKKQPDESMYPPLKPEQEFDLGNAHYKVTEFYHGVEFLGKAEKVSHYIYKL